MSRFIRSHLWYGNCGNVAIRCNCDTFLQNAVCRPASSCTPSVESSNVPHLPRKRKLLDFNKYVYGSCMCCVNIIELNINHGLFFAAISIVRGNWIESYYLNCYFAITHIISNCFCYNLVKQCCSNTFILSCLSVLTKILCVHSTKTLRDRPIFI